VDFFSFSLSLDVLESSLSENKQLKAWLCIRIALDITPEAGHPYPYRSLISSVRFSAAYLELNSLEILPKLPIATSIPSSSRYKKHHSPCSNVATSYRRAAAQWIDRESLQFPMVNAYC
jgi:hypothetical protein